MSTGQIAPNIPTEGLQAFFRGEFVPLKDANVNIMTHALHYGTGVFEGIRGNWNQEQGVVNIFRLREHYERLVRGCRLLMLDIPLLRGRAVPHHRGVGGVERAPAGHIHPAPGLQERRAGG